MALVLKDRVLETCTSPGTGTITLLGAVTGYQAFSTVGNGNTCYYAIADQNGANWECGIGTYSSGTLARTTVLSSSNAGSLTNFSTGSQNVFLTYPSERSVNLSSAALTSGRVAYATTDGLLTDSANLQFDGNNLGLGVTPRQTSGQSIEFGGSVARTAINFNNSADAVGWVTANAYYDGTNFLRVFGSGTSSTAYSQNQSGSHRWYLGAAGTANTAITFTQAMTLDSSGNLGVGTTSPTTDGNRVIHIANSSGDSRLHLTDNTTGAAASDGTEIVVNNGNFYIDQKESQPIIILVGGSERMRITSAGLVGIGTSSPFGKLDVSTSDIFTVLAISNTNANAGARNWAIATNAQQYGDINFYVSNAQGGNPISAGTTKMTILSNGNVGIGESTPSALLQVGTGAAASTVQAKFLGGVTVFENSGATTLVPTITFNNDLDTGINSPAANTVGFYTAGSERMRIDSGGAVGIGNTNAASFTTFSPKLVVGSGSGGQRITIYSGAGQEGDLIFADGTTGNEQYRGTVRYDHADDAMKFYTNGGINAMVISSAQNVGIGATSPVAKLHVKGSGTSGQVTASFILENSSSGTGGMDITGSAGASRWRFLYGGGPSTGTNALTEAMCIGTEGTNAGRVGIGTSSPQAKLQVTSSAFPVLKVADELGGGAIALGDAAISGNYVGIWRGAVNSISGGGFLNVQGNGIAFMSTDNVFGSATRTMTLDNGGNLLLGTTASNYRLNVKGGGTVGDSSVYAQFTTLDTGTTATDGLLIGLGVGSSPAAYVGQYENAPLIFLTNGTEKMRITSGGSLLLGTTTFTSSSAITVGLIAGNFRSIYATTTVGALSTATILTLSSSATGVYIVQANFGAQGNEIYGGMLIVVANAGSFRIVTNGSGANCALTLSGANVQITNALGVALDATGTAILIGNGN